MAERTLTKVLPLRTAVSTSAGLASAAVNFLATVDVAIYVGGRSAWLAILVAGALIMLTASNFSELNGLFPSAAAIRVWTRRGLNDQLSLVSSLVYATTVVFVIAADAFVLGHVFQAAVPAVPGIVWVVVILGVTAVFNLRGVRVAGLVQDTNAFFLLGTLAVISIIVIASGPAMPVGSLFQMGPRWFQGVALGVFIFVGFEWVSPLAEEFQDARAIPRGMYMALGLIAVAFGLFALALADVFPHPASLSSSLIPQLLVGERALGPLGFWWMAVVTLTTAMTTFNGGLVSASRFVYALARERSLPPSWARLNARLVPARALLGLTALALVLALAVYATRQYTLLIDAGAGVESLMYALTTILIIRLRRREPNRPRPYRAFWYPVLPVTVGLVFVGLAAGALTTTAIPGGVPWALIFVLGLTAVATGYVMFGLPRKRREARKREPTLSHVNRAPKA